MVASTAIPAALMRPSSRPAVLSTSPTTRSQSFSDVTSSAWSMPSRPARSVAMARPPSRATASFTAAPIAPAAPLISTTLSLRRLISITQPCAGVHHHHRRRQQRNLPALPAVLREHLAETHHQLLARPHHPSDRDQPLALGRRQQVDLELGGQRGGVLRHQRQRRETARGIGDHRGESGVDEAVLLRQLGRKRQRDLAFTLVHGGHRRADRAHRALAGEAREAALAGDGIDRHAGTSEEPNVGGRGRSQALACLASRAVAAAISLRPSWPRSLTSFTQASVTGSACLRQRSASSAATVVIGLPRALIAASAVVASSSHSWPAAVAIARPLFLSIIDLRSAGSASYFALFMASTKVVV